MASDDQDRLTPRWLRGMITSSILLAVAVWRLAAATVQSERVHAVLWGLVVVVGVTIQTFVMKRYRVRGRLLGWKWRAWWQGQQILVGAVLLVGWGGAGERAGLGFAGLLAVFTAVSWAVSEIRESTVRKHEPFGYWLAAAVVLLLVGFFAPYVPQRLSVAFAIAGSVAAYVAIVTGSQRVFRAHRTVGAAPTATRGSTRLRLVVGLTAFGVPTYLLHDVSGWWGLGAAIGVLLVVTLGVSRSEWNPVLFVAGFVAILLIAPTPTPLDHLPAATAGPEEMFVVFGDSYISGEGARNFYDGTNRVDDNQCRRAPTAWPVQLALEKDNGVPDEMLFLACSGARARELWWIDQGSVGDDWTTWQEEGQGQLAQFRAESKTLGDKPIAFALVSIGGNDAGFSAVATSCLAPAECTDVARQWVDGLVGRRRFGIVPDSYHQGDGSPPPEPIPGAGLTTMQRELELAYGEIRSELGDDVPIIAVPYPHPVRATGCDSTLLSDREHAFIEAFVDDLNGVVRAAAVASDVHYMDTIPDALAGRRLCDTTGSHVGVNFLQFSPINGSFEDIIIPASAIHGSMHPNGTGHKAMAAAAKRWFARTDLTEPPVHEPRVRSTPSAASLVAAEPPDSCPAWDDDDGDDATPNFRCDANGWAVRQILETAGTSSLFIVLLLGGAWLLGWEIVDRVEGWRMEAVAGPGFRYAPSPPEHYVMRVLDLPPLRWIHGGVDPRRE